MVVELKGFYTKVEAAKLLGIGRRTLYRWLAKGKITPVVVAGGELIPESEIDRIKADGQNKEESSRKHDEAIIATLTEQRKGPNE